MATPFTPPACRSTRRNRLCQEVGHHDEYTADCTSCDATGRDPNNWKWSAPCVQCDGAGVFTWELTEDELADRAADAQDAAEYRAQERVA